MRTEAADALLLIGGKNSRMGRRKDELPIGKVTTMGERMVRELERAVGCPEPGRVWVSCGEMEQEEYAGCPAVRDVYPGCGPIGGIHAGLRICRRPYLMAAACDMPFLKAELFWYLMEQIRQCARSSGRGPDGAVPVLNGRMQPLAAIYSRGLAPYLEQCIKAGNYRMSGALGEMNILHVDVSGNRMLAKMLRNVNTAEEYAQLRKEELPI